MRATSSLILTIAASALTGCASPGHAPVAAAATAAPSTTAPAAAQTDRFVAPDGYRHVVMNGEVRYCRTERTGDSRAQRQEVCLTEAQLKAREASSRSFIDQVQRSGATAGKTCTPSMGSASGMC
jgi:hypothetical protein